MTFPPPVSVIKRIKYFSTHVRTRVDGHGYMDADRCSLPYASQWCASNNGPGYTDTGAQTQTGVAKPLSSASIIQLPIYHLFPLSKLLLCHPTFEEILPFNILT